MSGILPDIEIVGLVSPTYLAITTVCVENWRMLVRGDTLTRAVNGVAPQVGWDASASAIDEPAVKEQRSCPRHWDCKTGSRVV
jgi:hypothetical protein